MGELWPVRNNTDRIGCHPKPENAEARQCSLKLTHHESALFAGQAKMIARPVFGSTLVKIAHGDFTDIDRLLHREDFFDNIVCNEQRHAGCRKISTVCGVGQGGVSLIVWLQIIQSGRNAHSYQRHGAVFAPRGLKLAKGSLLRRSRARLHCAPVRPAKIRVYCRFSGLCASVRSSTSREPGMNRHSPGLLPSKRNSFWYSSTCTFACHGTLL